MDRVREGGVEVRVPADADGQRGDGVFFNPEMELNRDITIAVLRAFREREPRAETYLDATAASGIRGVRAAADGWKVTCCDVDPDATTLCRANLRGNDLTGRTRTRDANVELHSNRYDVVDLDPFGSPAPFADAAVRGTNRLLCVTATDTAPLCGAHFDAGVRRYEAVPRNTEYHPEMGVRILLSFLARTAARRDVGITPLLTHATRHYVRTYLAVDRSASSANAAIDALGFLIHCPECLYRDASEGLIHRPPPACPNCEGENVLVAGPVWLAAVHDSAVIEAARTALDTTMGSADRAHRLLRTLAEELETPTHYDQHTLCKRWSRSATAMDEFLDALRTAGFGASRAHYSGTAFKTDASVSEIRAATGE
ncbi:MAG: tRNA (guanine(26)-N(2))-dimethyltransferase [Halobacteriales archaeon]|nr:tRNA (guanine(26)-N(2))-dimethyltransferase [Halobacteriales archaeon]